MKYKNSLLISDLRQILAIENVKAIQDLCCSKILFWQNVGMGVRFVKIWDAQMELPNLKTIYLRLFI